MQVRISSIVRCARGEDAAAWRAALEGGEWIGAAVVMKENGGVGGSWVRRARVMGREVVVKCRELDSAWKRVKFGVGMGHGAKQWRGAELLMGAKVRTAAPFALARGRVDGRVCELLVMEYVPGPTLLECMRDATEGWMPVRAQHAIARAVAKQASSMGWTFNRDHKPSNLIVIGADSESPEIAVIDCVGVRLRQVLRTERMLASLVIEPTGCGVRPRRALMMRAVRSLQEELERWHDPSDDEDELPEAPMTPRERVKMLVRNTWSEAARIVNEHGDPRPRVDPLERGRSSPG